MRNVYEDGVFFAEYGKMERSREGLSGAGEWERMKGLFPPLAGKRVLDLGCGYGWHCGFAAKQGASEVLGIDLSSRMIGEALERNPGERISYRVCGLEEYEYPDERWDLAVSNLALHYIEDLDSVFRKVYRTLAPGGVFLFNMEHPVFTAGVEQDWIYDGEGRPLYWPVDRYYYPGERQTHFLGCEVMKFHHTLSQILTGLLNCGFVIQAVCEPEPPESMRGLPGMDDEMRRPMMLIVRAGKEVR